jgi:hypothetical protein
VRLGNGGNGEEGGSRGRKSGSVGRGKKGGDELVDDGLNVPTVDLMRGTKKRSVLENQVEGKKRGKKHDGP